MPLLLLIGIGLFFTVKHITLIAVVIPIAISGATVITLASVWMGISYRLQKLGYRPRNTKQTYHQVESSLHRIAEDLTEIRLQLDDMAPYLRDMEFLKYARQNRQSEN